MSTKTTMKPNDYHAFLDTKTHVGGECGFTPDGLPSFLFDFQRSLVEWALRKGLAAIFADCGLGKTPMQIDAEASRPAERTKRGR